MDVALEPISWSVAGRTASEVSILVLVDVALEPRRRLQHHPHTAVSILDLVDVALELTLRLGTDYPVISFNPCSRGCRS